MDQKSKFVSCFSSLPSLLGTKAYVVAAAHLARPESNKKKKPNVGQFPN
jgi:3-phosphoglycerate kinase